MNKKNWQVLILAGIVALFTFNSCKKSDDQDEVDSGPTEWNRGPGLTGDPRTGAASFQIEGVGYLTTGLLKNNERATDTYSLNIESGQWEEVAEFIGDARHGATGFAIGNNGFVGTGYNGETSLNDFYKYNSANDTWEEIAQFPGEGRYDAVAFALDGYGYVGLGSTESGKQFNDFYKYDPSSDSWTKLSSNFAFKKAGAFAFVIGDKAYIGGGVENNQYPEDFYEFNGEDFKPIGDIRRTGSETFDVTRSGAAVFTIGNYGYVVAGKKGSVLSNVWKFDPSKDTWTNEHQSLLGSARENAVSFSWDGKGYITTGNNGSSTFYDTWVFNPVR